MKSEQKRFRFFNLKHWFYIILVCLCILNSSTAFAENRVEAERQNWEIFTSTTDIKTILLSDDKKTLWVGTRGGLEERDAITGLRKRLITKYDGLHNNNVTSIKSDGRGGIWIFTGPYIELEQNSEAGIVNISSGGDLKIYDDSESAGLPVNFFRDEYPDGNGGFWYITDNDLKHILSDGSEIIYDTADLNLPDNRIWSLEPDVDGCVWLGTPIGLVRLSSDGNFTIYDATNFNLPCNGVGSIESDGIGGLWMDTCGGLGYLSSNGDWKNYDDNRSELPDNSIGFLESDGNGGIWIGSGGIITHRSSNGSWKQYDYYGELQSDGSGGIWIGTYFEGLIHIESNGNEKTYDINNSDLPSNQIHALESDGNRGLWIGTDAGLAHLSSNGRWEIYYSWFGLDDWLSSLLDDTTIVGLPSDNIRSLKSDNSGGIWVGTDEGLAHLLSDQSWKIYDTSNLGLTSNYIAQLESDGRGGVWFTTGMDSGFAHLSSEGSYKEYYEDNSDLPSDRVNALKSDNSGGVWIGTGFGGLAHMLSNGKWEFYNTDNSALSGNYIECLESDQSGGLWIGTGFSGLFHFLQLGTPEQIITPNSPEITINWFLNSSSLDYQNVKYIELQRSLSQDGVYETVLDASDKPVRFYADYSICPKPRVDGCWVTVEGHTPETRTNSDGSTTKGYTLNTPINDPEWLEGLPRYYRLSAVIEEDGKLVRVANNSEAALITPQVEEKPRVELTLDKNAVAMQPNQKSEITVFVSSLDLFRGDVDLEVVSGEGVAISDNTNTANGGIVETHDRASLRGSNGSENDLSSTISLKSGETKPVLLTIDALSENNQTIKIIPKIQSGYSGRSTSLNVQVGNGTNSMIALSIAHKTKRSRVLDSLTISGNVIPAQAGQKVIISGNNIKESAESATFTTDEKGYFQGTVTPIHAGLLTLTAQSNGITSNNAEIFILSARTNIALSSNVNQSTKKGDILRVQGIITPVRLDGTKVNLDIRYLDPANQDAGLQPQFVGGVEIDVNGVFYRDIVVPGNGFINVKASLPETSDYLSVNTKLVIPIGQPVGEGIIVVSESGNADFQTISKSLGNYVYHALKSRNIPAERIKYLGLGGDKIIDDFKLTTNLATDNFGKTNKANLHDALTNWATSLFSTDDPYKTPLNLYLIGKVEDENNGFRLNDNEVLTADDLAKYLDEAEEILKNKSKDKYSENKGFPVTIVLEGTQSGKWIEKIAGNGRIILTSSSNKPIDEGGFAGYDNLGEISFSRYFYQFINYGYDIEGSFAEASYEILKFYRHKQRPVMDADGDGIGTTNYDSYEASGKFIEYRPSGNLRPQIITTNPDRTIKRRIGVSSDGSGAGSGSHFDDPILWAIAADPEEQMDGVFCSITDPSNKTVNIEMKRKFDNQNVYEIDLSQTYPNLAIGFYHAVYYAKDKAGNVSLPEQKHLNVISSNADQGGGGVPNPPQFTISVDDESSMAAVSWSEVSNADGYKLFYCPYPDCPPADIGEIDMGNQREITFDGRGFAFYGAVKAYNSNGFSGWSNVEFFNLK